MHALHAILTLLTCGMWLPIWLIFAIIDAFSNKSPTVAIGGAGAPAAPFYGAPVQAPAHRRLRWPLASRPHR